MSFVSLKMIALLSMLWDHIYRVQEIGFKISYNLQSLPISIGVSTFIVGLLGRIAAPIFMFSVANGYLHTKNIKHYLSRLLTFALISQIPYILANQVWYEEMNLTWKDIDLNIIFTLFTGLVAILIFEKLSKYDILVGLVCVVFMGMLAKVLHMEGGYRYIAYIFVFFITWKLEAKFKILIWLIVIPLSYFSWTSEIINNLIYGTLNSRELESYIINALGPFIGVLLTFLYNGKKGTANNALKYLWYIFYPAHLLIIGILF